MLLAITLFQLTGVVIIPQILGILMKWNKMKSNTSYRMRAMPCNTLYAKRLPLESIIWTGYLLRCVRNP